MYASPQRADRAERAICELRERRASSEAIKSTFCLRDTQQTHVSISTKSVAERRPCCALRSSLFAAHSICAGSFPAASPELNLQAEFSAGNGDNRLILSDKNLERARRIERPTLTLARLCSTPELRPQSKFGRRLWPMSPGDSIGRCAMRWRPSAPSKLIRINGLGDRLGRVPAKFLWVSLAPRAFGLLRLRMGVGD